jgi:putative endonuclease
MRPPDSRYIVYIVSNNNREIFISMTTNLQERIVSIREGKGSKYASARGLTKLVYFEMFSDRSAAVARMRQMKSWRRIKKDMQIEIYNSEWCDLSEDWDVNAES